MAQNNTTSRNEGEGSRTAAKQYNDATEKFAKSGKVEPAAKAAEKSLESDEAEELERAEEEGKRHAVPGHQHKKPS
jgi:hypothetical protein